MNFLNMIQQKIKYKNIQNPFFVPCISTILQNSVEMQCKCANSFF